MRESQQDTHNATYERLENQLEKEGYDTRSFEATAATSHPSKEIDMALKMVVVLHVAFYAIENAINGGELVIPLEITEHQLHNSFSMVSILRNQQQRFIKAALDHKQNICNSSSGSTSLTGNLSGIDAVVKKLLVFPGQEMTSNMVVRKEHLKGTDVIQAMEKLAGGDAPIGTMKKFGHNKKIVGFFKKQPDDVDDADLLKYEIDKTRYSASFDKDLTNTPITGISNWQDYIRVLRENAP